METLVVGEGALTLHEVSSVIEESPSFANLQTNWRSFAIYIGVKDAELPGLDRRINLGTLQLKEAPREVLKIWKAGTGTRATLKTLCDALEKCELKAIADDLVHKFCPPKGEKLPKFMLQDKLYSLEGLFENGIPEPISKMVQSRLKGHTTTKPIKIIRQEVCSVDLHSLYYIPRTLSWRNKLDEKIFRANETKDHIFLVKGGGKPELAHASGLKPIERSGNQLDKVTVQHILLECDDDCDVICGNTSKPVHVIEFQDDSFFHLKSSKGIEAIQSFIKESNNVFGEEEAVDKIAKTQSPSILSIADSPGMGKSFLLANLSAQIKKTYPKVITLFIVLQELAQTLDSCGSAIKAISNYATSDNLTYLIFQEILSNRKYQFYLFLDGYDEVLENQLHLIDSFLHKLTSYPNIKTIITTRVHVKGRLENISQRLSYEILPFSESNQIDFLTKYWSSKHGAENGEILKSFAQKCLHALKENLTPAENDIAGVPLQCSMLAEVYADHAKRAAKLKTLPEDVVKITSFFEMYKSLVEIKFKRIGNSQELRQKYFDAHVYDSIALLFPDWLERFKVFLSPRDEVEETMIYSIGLIEKSPSSNTPRFQHRTFAENFLAQFVVGNLEKDGTLIEFLYTEIFKTVDKSQKKIRDEWAYYYPMQDINRHQIKEPVIANFVEMHLRDRIQRKEFNQLAVLAAIGDTSITDEIVCIAVKACCCYGLENCFDFTKQMLRKINIKQKFHLQNEYCKYLPHFVVERTENASLLKKVLNLAKTKFQVDFQWHVADDYYCFDYRVRFRHCTPLHVAAYHGKYNMFTYLLEEYAQEIPSIKYLMHCCLHESSKNSETVIEDKVSIIKSLTTINPKWLEEEDNYGHKPILRSNAHVRLIKYMVQLGVDINTYCEDYGTILHTGGDKNTYADLVRWALSSGFTLINNVDWDSLTPLRHAIIRFGSLDDDVLSLFLDAGADINAQDYGGDSVLFYAIRYSRNLEFVKKVLDLGANLTHRNKRGENAAHLIIGYYRLNPQFALKLLRLLELYGFKGFNQKNSNGDTPLQLAKYLGVTDEELLNFLKDRNTRCSVQ